MQNGLLLWDDVMSNLCMFRVSIGHNYNVSDVKQMLQVPLFRDMKSIMLFTAFTAPMCLFDYKFP